MIFNNLFKFLISFFILISFLSCEENPDLSEKTNFTSPNNKSLERNEFLVIGSIGGSYSYESKFFEPLADYLTDNLSSFGIKTVKICIAKDFDQFVEYNASNNVDIFFDSIYPSLKITESCEFEPFLEQWKNNSKSYQSIIFAQNNSDIQDVRDLKGKIICFENEYSTTGYFLPKVLLQNSGLELTRVYDLHQQFDKNKVAYIFSEDDENSMVWVLKGKVAAGCTDDFNFKKNSGPLINQLKIIGETKEYPRQYVSFSKRLNPKLREAIINLMLNLNFINKGKHILDSFYNTVKFEKLDTVDFKLITKEFELYDRET